jgi:hypothetical protein
MSQEINKYVARAIVEIAIFLEFSKEDVVAPDASIQALEQLAATLQMADLKTKKALCLQFEEVSAEYSGEQADFVESLGESLGLGEE